MSPKLSNRFGTFLRERRNSLGITMPMLAERTGWSVSMLEKVEGGAKSPSLPLLAALFDALLIPYQFRERLLATLFPGLLERFHGGTDTAPDPIDAAALNGYREAAAYVHLPATDIVAITPEFEKLFPRLLAGGNMLEWLFDDPIARVVLPDWEALAHSLVYGLKLLGPGLVPADRMQKIIDRCAGHQEWTRLWNSNLPNPTAMDATVRIRNVYTGQIRRFELRVDRTELPRRLWSIYRLIEQPTDADVS